MLRVSSPLTSDQERIVESVVDCAFVVHREIGPGFRERIYQRALCLEMDSRHLRFEAEKAVEVRFKDWLIPGQRVDLIVEDIVLVEIKSIPMLKSLHRAQVVSYLKTTGLRVGLLINFNVEFIKNGLKRIVK